jgi:hypothetical protein
MRNITEKLLTKLFPKTISRIEKRATSFAFEQGMNKGRLAQREFIDQQIRKHDLSDFDNPALMLGYAHAVKAIRGELRDVA